EFLRILDPFHGFMRGLRAREVNPLQIGGARAGGVFDPARGAVRKTRMERGLDPGIGLHNVDYATYAGSRCEKSISTSTRCPAGRSRSQAPPPIAAPRADRDARP